MKKRALSVFFTLAFLVFTVTVIWAQGRPQEKGLNLPQENQAVKNQKVEYFLPYPGILPDHPLYPLKILRDRILDFLIRDPVKRVEFNLLMSDKRLNMGVYLTEKNKPQLSEQTVSKGEKYFVRALNELEKAKNQGREIRDSLLQKLQNSLLKHQEVVSSLQKESPKSLKEGYESSLKIIRENQERLRKIGE